MLEALRKSAGSLVGKLILGLLVVAFAVWGITDVLMGNTGTTAARVSGKEITTQQYAREFSALSRQARLTAEEARARGLDREALSRLLSAAAMDAQAEELGLVAGDATVAREISADPNFADLTGGFSQASYERLLLSAGMRPQDYEADVRSRLTRELLTDSAVLGAAPPRAAVEALEIHEAERRAAQYLLFSVADQPEPEAPSEEVLQAFHQIEAPLFTTPELRAGDWLELSAQSLIDPEGVTEAEVRAQYDAQAAARFTTPEARRIEQILFDDEASARAAALRAKEGESLVAIAEGMGRSAQEVRLGLLPRAGLPADLAAAAFGLEAPGVAEPFAGGFGWTLAGVTEIRPVQVVPFEQAREELTREIATNRARQRLPTAILDVEDYIAGGSSLAEIAERLKLTHHAVAETDKDGFAATGVRADTPLGFPAFLQTLFSAAPGAAPSRLDAPGSETAVYFLQTTSATPATLKPFESVREEVLRAWTDRQKRDGAAARAASALEAVKSGRSLLAVSAEQELTLQEAPLFGRRESPLDLGPEAVSALFAAAEGAPVEAEAQGGGGRVVAVVSEIVAPSAADVAAQTDRRLGQFAELLRADLTDALVAATVEAGGPHIYEAAVATASQSTY